jgi:gamma-glutamylcyclotransferase (GGCT)/AIG2-like uncharacterized protein YtfP
MQKQSQDPSQSNLLFIYGTLMQAENSYGAYLRDNSELLGKAKLRGKLFDIGPYPGAHYIPGSDLYTFGHLLKLRRPNEALQIIDEYEGFGATELQPNEFVREIVQVEYNNGPVICWAYLYNHPVDDLSEIKSGDYIDFLRQNQ